MAKITDKADIQKQVAPYLPSTIEYDVHDFSFIEAEYPVLKGKKFQVLIIESRNENLPYICIRDGDSIKSNVIYIRKGTNSTEAGHEDVQRIINLRLDTKYSSTNILKLEEHLEQLKVLYKELPRKISGESIFSELGRITIAGLYGSRDNPMAPKETYEEFLGKLIAFKKLKIKDVLNL